MSFPLAPLWRRLLFYLRRARFEHDMAEELRFHVDLQAEHNRHAGMSADAARFHAMRRLGNATLIREEAREAMTFPLLETFTQDLRYATRALRKRPGFAAVVVLTLALGMGGATAMFSVINTVLLRPLPFPQPDRLVMVWEWREGDETRTNPVAPTNFKDWVVSQSVFSDMSVVGTSTVNLTGAGDPEEVRIGYGSPSLFRVLGVGPVVGRTFTPEDVAEGSTDVAVLSESAWRRRFGADPGIVGRTLDLSGRSVMVIGVVPASVSILNPEAEFWTATDFRGLTRKNSGRFVRAVARLKDGVTRDQAQAQMTTIAGRLEREYPEFNAGWSVNVVPMHRQLVGDVRAALLVLFGAVGCLLLIAATNVSNLLLARASSRKQEIAIRTALGAGRKRVIQQLLTESMVLSLLGAVAGVLLARWGVSALVTLLPPELDLPRVGEIAVDLQVLGFAALVALFTGVFFGLAPAIEVSKTSVTRSLREEGRTNIGSRRTNRFRSALAIAQVALALVLLAGSGLLIRSFVRLQAVDVGFDPRNVLTFRINRPGGGPDALRRRIAFFEEARQRVAALPGVVSASGLWFLPLSGDASITSFTVEGRPRPDPKDEPVTSVSGVQRDYFETMRIPLRRGRTFTEHDRADAPKVGVINETMARQQWPGEDPVGKRIRMEWGQVLSIEVVGVVGDTRFQGQAKAPMPELYMPYAQLPAWAHETFVVRTSGNPAALGEAIVREIRALDPNQPVTDVRPMTAVLSASVAQPRLNAVLLGTFAGLALLLAAVGIYGVLSYSVAQRTHEIGVRVALGADRRAVLRLVLLQVARLALIGVAIGTVAALALTRLMRSLLFDVSANDPLTFGGVALLLTGVAMLAAFIPARRAARVHPMVALRG